jgi:triosephosphate isomerase
MMRTPILAGNWKMHKTSAEVRAFFKEFSQRTQSNWVRADIMFAVPYTLLAVAQEAADGMATIIAQNVHFEASGAYTGEISIDQLRDLGILGSLVGHSERRQYYGETDDTVAKKVTRLTDAGMLALACVGESRAERESNQTEAVVTRQIQSIFNAAKSIDRLVIAYEPVWAIGTGLTATDEQAQAVHKLIRGLAREHFGEGSAAKLRILYGGSAKPDNIAGLMQQPDIDGGLIGGASLKPIDFAAMIDNVTQ